MEHRLRNGQHREEPLVQVRRTAQRRQLLFQGQQLNGRQDRGVQAERHLALRQGTFAAEPDGRRSDAHLQATRHHGDARQPLRFQGQQSHPFAGQGGAGALLERRRPDQSGQLHQRSRYGNHPQLGQSDQGLRAQYERHEGQDRNHLQRRGRVPSQLRHLPLRPSRTVCGKANSTGSAAAASTSWPRIAISSPPPWKRCPKAHSSPIWPARW